jgi:hypothetical protein
MSDHKQNLTDLAAMFAMAGMIARVQDGENLRKEFIVADAYDFAEELMIVREERMAGHSDDEPDEDEGIAAIKPKRTRRGGK